MIKIVKQACYEHLSIKIHDMRNEILPRKHRWRLKLPLLILGMSQLILSVGNTQHFMYLLHTCHSCFVPEGVAEISQIFLRDTHVLPKL
jgi:hypothetical protein